MPVDHAEQQAHIEITLSGSGKFRSASVVAKETTFIPATEGSAGRTSGPVPHGLADKLEYLAAAGQDQDDREGELDVSGVAIAKGPNPKKDNESAHALYLDQLREWVALEPDPHVEAVLRYIEGGSIITDLINSKVLYADADGNLLTRWHEPGTPPAIFKVLTAAGGERNQRAAVVRWIVSLTVAQGSAELWKNQGVQHSWQRFVAKRPREVALCMLTGQIISLAKNHPKRIRHGADGAKLISSNDKTGYNFRFKGKFDAAEQAYGLGSISTQKAHSALRWLIDRQGYLNDTQAIVAWAVGGSAIPKVIGDSKQMQENAVDELGIAHEQELEFISASQGYRGDVGQLFAKQLNNLMRGYQARLAEREDVVVLAIESAMKDKGGLAITYHRELHASEFLDRIHAWHESTAWPQNFGKDRQFVGAPAPRDIAETAYGRRVDDKLKRATVERLLPCIVDGTPIPLDLVVACFHRATNRVGFKEHWEWERCLGIACALIRGGRRKEDYKMTLEEDRTSRSYLFGRLLAVAEKIESHALYLAKEKRDTTAERLMQRFSDHPASTWRTIELSLRPYMQRLQNSRPKSLYKWKQMLDDIINRFQKDEFTRIGRLDPEFLLGYHCQRAALRWKDTKNEVPEQNGQEPQLA